MADTHKQASANQPAATVQLEAGTYEIIRNRLSQQADDLRQRLDQLNAARKQVFGAVESQLIANDRINTANYCVARDIISLGQWCLFGYNVHIGLRAGIKLEDVFSLYHFQENTFKEGELTPIRQEKFELDFQNLYRYYKEAFFSRFVRQGTYFYMVFQVSANPQDIKAFKRLIRDEELVYIDARSEHEIRKPEQHEFRWVRAGREDQRQGRHPHMSIMDRVFVETVGGDLTIKVEDNTNDGKGIYEEEVAYPDQSLDDAEYLYADLGNLIALKIRPYQEDFRYFVFNERLQEVQRIDALEDSGVLLPDNQGLIFANGYYLQTGEFKIFDVPLQKKHFEKRIISPNGEDYLFVFQNDSKGTYLLHQYNLIEQKVETPIHCHGFALFPDGELSYFKTEDEPSKHHVVQIWQTPFLQGKPLPSAHKDSFLYKIGNKDIVKAMAECHEVLTLSAKDDSYTGLYDDLVKICTNITDSYYWIDKDESFHLEEPLLEIKATATAAIEEYDKKISIQRATTNQIAAVEKEAKDIFKEVDRQSFDQIDAFVQALADLRKLRGAIISLKDLRYTNLELINELEVEAVEKSERLSEACVEFLLDEKALAPYQAKIEEKQALMGEIKTAREADDLGEEVTQIGDELQLLIDIVSNLKIEDATHTTAIVDNISQIFARLNQVKAGLKRHKKDLAGTEAKAEFNAQIRLLDQGIINFLELSETPQQCDTYLTKLMIQLEELESKFVEYDTFTEKLTDKREEIYNAFEGRKKSLLEALNNRTTALQQAADRILGGIQQRSQSFEEVDAINGFFAADLMVDKVRDIIKQLRSLQDTNKADAVQTRLKSLQEEAIRSLRDQQDLFVKGENIIKFGKHQFSVNVQPLDLTIVQKENQLYYHLTGTNFYEVVDDASILEMESVWSQHLPSENKQVYRAEYLAYCLWEDYGPKVLASQNLLELAQKEAGQRYEEGYIKGIHAEDAAQILEALLQIHQQVGVMAYTPKERVLARFIWEKCLGDEQRQLLLQQIQSASLIREVFPDSDSFEELKQSISEVLTQALSDQS
ncbi:MAG: DNA repair ATPase [Saprospiraceae bacterium]|nr:DNA repair ATPase [Saprospiraceae bacterium]